MTQSLTQRPAELSLAVWLAPFAAGRRVLWIGDASSGAPDQLAATAESVRVLDTTGRGRRRRGGVVRVSTFRPGPIDLPPGTFDLAIVTEVSVLDELTLRLRELARAVGDEGVVVAGTLADDGRYDVLRDALADACGTVRVLGQATFRGVALADLSSESADAVVVDGTLAGESGIDRIWALGADELPAFEPYLVVQLPSELPASVLTTAVELEAPREEKTEKTAILEEALVGRSREADALREALERAESRLEQLQGRLVGTESELSEARAALREIGSAESDSAQEIAAIEERLRERGARVRELEVELDHRALLVRDLTEELREHQLGRRGGGAKWLDAEAARTEAELATDELRVALLAREEELATTRAREAELDGAVRDLRARAAELAELHETAAARVRMLELERQDRAEAHRALEAKVGELSEQLELAWIQARGAARAPAAPSTETDPRLAELEASEKNLSARVGELSGQLVAARDLIDRLEAERDRVEAGQLTSELTAARELAERLEDERDRARAETLRLAAQLSAFETRVEGLRRGYEHRIAMLASEVVPVPSKATGTDEAIERELARVREELASLRGEREGLRMRLRDREAALATALTARAPAFAPEELDRLRDEITSLRAQSDAFELRSVDLAEAKERAEQRAADLGQKLAGRDALLTRLQMDLAEEEQTAKMLDEKLARARAEAVRLREAVVDASSAVDAKERAEKRLTDAAEALRDAERRAAEVDVLREKLARLEETSRASIEEGARWQERAEAADAERRIAHEDLERLRSELARAVEAAERIARERADAAAAAVRSEIAARMGAKDGALAELRVGLTDLRRVLDGWRVEEGAGRRRAEITEVGLEAPEGEDGRVVRLEREIDDKDTLLRSLTAQLEERDDRLRALERRLAEGGPAGDGEDVRRELLELQERVSRLHDELAQERQARGLAEEQVGELKRRPAADEALARLERSLREREAALREATSRAGAFERDVESLRGVCAQAREGLEALLGTATDRGDPRTAERIGELLGVLGRFS
jgi:chromosome segregation ATPase